MKLQLCKHLRSKKMYVPVQADELQSGGAEVLENIGTCWCNRTLAEVGPDDRQVGAQVCSQTRSCFED